MNRSGRATAAAAAPRLAEVDEGSRRVVRPLGLWFWGASWTLVGWCELRNDFRMFRLDRMVVLEATDRRFKPERGRSLADFFRMMELRNDGQGGGCALP